jgi:hypothetical protein
LSRVVDSRAAIFLMELPLGGFNIISAPDTVAKAGVERRT